MPATVNDELVAEVSPVAAADSVNAPWVPRVIAQPENAATPPVGVTGSVVHASVPVPVAIARVTGAADAVTTSPEESSTVATGWVVSAMPPVEAIGCVVKTTLVAGPATMNAALIADVSPVAAPVSLNDPCVPSVMAQPENAATPDVAARGSCVQASEPVPVEIVSVTDALLEGTTLPAASSTETTGWVLSSTPPVEFVGCVVMMSFVALP